MTIDYQKGFTLLKAAILGTENYHATMRQVADSGLRRMMCYVPQRMKPDNPVLPVHVDYLPEADLKMQEFGNEWLTNCNPRSPYLFLAWLLIGSDNKYRACQYLDEMRIPKRVAGIHVCIALGFIPMYSTISNAEQIVGKLMQENWESDAVYAAWRAIWSAARAAEDYTHIGAVGSVARLTDKAAWTSGVAENQQVAWDIISTKSREWAYISDEEALQIARQLTLDILEL